MIAHYAGDGTNAPSDSSPVAVTVAKENSQVLIVIPTFDNSGNSTSVNASSVPYGSQFFIRMYAANMAATLDANGFPSPFCSDVDIVTCPTGTIALTDNGAVVDQGTFKLNNAGYSRNLSPSISTFTGGTHKIKAVYSGDNSFVTSTGNNTITVTPAVTQTYLATPPSTLLPDSHSCFRPVSTASFSPGAAVARWHGDILRWSDRVAGNSKFTCFPGLAIRRYFTRSFHAGDPHRCSVKYSGDCELCSHRRSTATTITVLNPVTITQSESSNSINYGQSITVTAKVIGAIKSPPISGQIQISGPSSSFTDITNTPRNGRQRQSDSDERLLQSHPAIHRLY